MKNEIFRIKELNGYILYQRVQTRQAGYASIPKYFILGGANDYYKEFRTLTAGKREFKKLTERLPEIFYK